VSPRHVLKIPHTHASGEYIFIPPHSIHTHRSGLMFCIITFSNAKLLYVILLSLLVDICADTFLSLLCKYFKSGSRWLFHFRPLNPQSLIYALFSFPTISCVFNIFINSKLFAALNTAARKFLCLSARVSYTIFHPELFVFLFL